LQSIHNKINELKDSLDTSDELTIDRIRSKITSYENEIQFIKTHPRSIVTSGNADKRKRNSIQKKRWSLPSENALAALGDNVSNNKRWSITSGSDGEASGEEDECLSSYESGEDEDMIDKNDPTYQDISNRFKGLLGGPHNHAEQSHNHAPPARPDLPSLQPLISQAQTEHSKRLSLNPYVLKNLSTSIPKTPSQPRNPFESDSVYSQTPSVPSLNLAGNMQRNMEGVAYTPRGTHVAGFYPPPNPHHSSQFQRTSSIDHQMTPQMQFAQHFAQQQPNPYQQHMQNTFQPRDLQQPYKPPQLVLPQRNSAQMNPLPRLSSLDTPPAERQFIPVDQNEDERYVSPLHKRQISLPSLPKFGELENQVDQYQQTMRHHSPQFQTRTDPFVQNHDPFMKSSNSHSPFAPSPLNSSSNMQEEDHKMNFIEKIFRKQIPFFKRRSASPAPKVM
jgi:hypothetical protein